MNMMGPYDPAEPLAQLIDQLEKGREFARSGGQKISDAMMTSKVITLLAQMGISMMTSESGDYNPPTSRRGQNTIFLHQAHLEQKREVATAGKGGYTTTVQNIYCAPPTSPEEHHEVIEDIQKIVQRIQTQGYNLE